VTASEQLTNGCYHAALRYLEQGLPITVCRGKNPGERSARTGNTGDGLPAAVSARFHQSAAHVNVGHDPGPGFRHHRRGS
jgi:hypothetical protein